MAKVSADRRLVKSPPELWAEVSDPETLARHLGEFGEIRITRTQPEKIVAWEGERTSGTVEIEASGWGTRVILTADTRSEPPRAEEKDERGTTRAPLLPRFAAPPAVKPSDAVDGPAAPRPAIPQPATRPPIQQTPPGRASTPPPVSKSTPPPATPLPPPEPSRWERRRSLLSRVFPRRPTPVAETQPDPPLSPVPEPPGEPAPSPPQPAPDPRPRKPEPLHPPQPAEPPEPAATVHRPVPTVTTHTKPEPPPAPPAPRQAPAPPAPRQAPAPPAPRQAPAPAPEHKPVPAPAGGDTLRVLESVLDDLGAAHHRPFSRG